MERLNQLIDVVCRAIGVRTIKGQLSLLFIILLLLASTSSGVLYFSKQNDADRINLAGAQRMLSQRFAKEALLVAADGLSRQSLEETAQRFETAHLALLNGDVSKGISAIVDNDTRQQLQLVGQHWRAYRQFVEGYLMTPAVSQLPELQRLSLLVLTNMHQAVGMMAATSRATALMQLQVALITSVGILVLVLLGLNYSRQTLVKPLQALTRALQRVGEGHFDQPLSLKGISQHNELGQVYHSYNSMLSQVGELLSHMHQVADRVATGVNEVREAAVGTSDGMKRQSDEVTRISHGMNEMNTTVAHVTENITCASEAAQKADTQAHDGAQAVSEMARSIGVMAGQVSHASEELTKLEEQSRQVDRVLEVIIGIAEQTNLLALNAAIEAARAGDQGRGFAVVSDEVRMLAQKTQNSTEEIRNIIDSLQTQAMNSVGVMSQSNSQAQQSVVKTQQADSALVNIAESVSVISDMNQQLATVAEQQSAVAQEMDASMQSVSSLAEETSQRATLMMSSADKIEGEMVELCQLVGRFTHLQPNTESSRA